MPNPDKPQPVGPLQKGPPASAQRKRKPVPEDKTEEASSYVKSLFDEFSGQATRYHVLTASLMQMEAKVELQEKLLCVTRDHLQLAIQKSETCVIPPNWKDTLSSVEFVGVRLVDACMTLLKRHHKLTTDDFVRRLNKGMFRFRTNTPLREIHAALLRQQNIERKGDTWIWTGDNTDQIAIRFRMASVDQTTTAKSVDSVMKTAEEKVN